MNKKYILAFAFGGAIGSVITYFATKKHFQAIVDDELKDIRQVFSREEVVTELKKSNPDKPDVSEYAAALRDNEYVDAEDISEEEIDEHPDPYIITYDDFGELVDYKTETFVFYADGVVAEEDTDKMLDATEVDDTIGIENIGGFNDPDADAIYIRNEKYKIDYEVIFDGRNYGDTPRPEEVELK